MQLLPMLHRWPNGIHWHPLPLGFTALKQRFRGDFSLGNLIQQVRFSYRANTAILAYPTTRHVVPFDSHRIVSRTRSRNLLEPL